jgi:hypothetical protein
VSAKADSQAQFFGAAERWRTSMFIALRPDDLRNSSINRRRCSVDWRRRRVGFIRVIAHAKHP